MTAILFDLDGTLLNTMEDLVDAVNVTLDYFGYPGRTREEVRRFVGNGARRLLRLAVPPTASDAEAEACRAWFQAYYTDHAQIKTCPYEGVLEALEEIKKEFPVAIVSNKPDKAVKLLCSHFFDGIYALGEREDCPRKPAPDMVRKAMEALGAARCIYVGDSEVDVLTAKNAQVPCLSVLWGFRDRQSLVAAGAEHFCDTPAELLKKLREMI